MNNWEKILTTNNLPTDECTRAFGALPPEIYFLQPQYLKHYWTMARLDTEHLAEVAAFASQIAQDKVWKNIIWYLHWYCLCHLALEKFPEKLPQLGNDSGKFFLLLALSFIRIWEERAGREGFPVKFARQAADRIGGTVTTYYRDHPENYGLSGQAVAFFRHFAHDPCFRIGRFDFLITHPYSIQPEIFAAGEQIIALCRDNWPIGADGYRCAEDNPDAWRTHLTFAAHQVRGNPIDLQSGQAQQGEITVDLKRFRRLAGPDNFVADIHIPGGSPLRADDALSSLNEAYNFFRGQFPQLQIQVFFSQSWLFSPDWLRELPQSNIAAVIRATQHFPTPWSPDNGMRFIFGRHQDNVDDYPQDTALRRAVVRLLRTRGYLRSGGMVAVFNSPETGQI